MTPSQYTQFFRSISTLIESGISPADAFRKINEDQGGAEWNVTLALLEQGKPFEEAMWSSGKLTRYEREVISLCESSGRLNEALRYLAATYEARLLRVKTLKSRLILPFAIILVGVVVSTLLAFVRAESFSFLNIIVSPAITLFVVLMLFRAALRVASMEACTLLSKAYFLNQKTWYRKTLQYTVFSALMWQTKSGIDFKSAFFRTAKLIDNKQLRLKLHNIGSACGKGLSVQESILRAELPLTADFRAILNSAEKSGSWNSALEHYLDMLKAELDDSLDHVMAWVPRIYYVFAVFVAHVVIF